MNINELAQQDLTIRIYGVVIEGLKLEGQASPELPWRTPVLIKGWGWKEVCIAVRERRILLLEGPGVAAEGCGWLDPVKMWTIQRTARTVALDVQAGAIELQASAHLNQTPTDAPTAERPSDKGVLAVDDDTARRFEQFLSDESLFNSTTWVAHNANNQL
jgi:hypothetical protein